jgi:hypothetical protein
MRNHVQQALKFDKNLLRHAMKKSKSRGLGFPIKRNQPPQPVLFLQNAANTESVSRKTGGPFYECLTAIAAAPRECPSQRNAGKC